MDVQFLHQPAAVRFGGLDGHVQNHRDFLGRLSFSYQLEHLPLARAEGIAGQLILGEIRLHDRARHARTQIHAAAADFMNRLEQMLGGLRLRHAALDAGAQRLQHVMLVGVHREQNHLGARRDSLDPVDCGQPVERRHGDVEHDHVGPQPLGQRDGLESVRCFADDLEFFAFEQHLHALTNDRMIIGQHHRGCHINAPMEFRW